MSRIVFSLALILAIALLVGCSSGGSNPVGPPGEDFDISGLHFPAGEGGHLLWGLYDLFIDPVSLAVKAVPSRTCHEHYDVTKYVTPPECDDCIVVKPKAPMDPETRVLEVDVTLVNPYPIAGFDVRGILLLTDAGHDLQYPDGWVSIWDDLKPPYFNPFMRYGKKDPDGKFPPFGELTQTYRLIVPKPPKYDAIKFAIDVVRPKKCLREPYEIREEQLQGFLYSDGSNYVIMTLKVLDRNDDVSKVTIECPEIFNGTKDMTQDGDLWTIQFSNENLAEQQIEPYIITIEAYDPKESYTLRDRYHVYVLEKQPFWMPGMAVAPIDDCSYDIAGVSGGPYDTGGYVVDADSGCTAFSAYDMYFSFPFLAVTLMDINPSNPKLQPYPPERFDSASGGGLAFTNTAVGMFQDGPYNVPMNQVVVTLDWDLLFKDDQLGNHQAHYPLYADTLGVVDVCDGFLETFYILWAETTGDDHPVIRGYRSDYSTKNQVVGGKFPADLVGEGAGKIVNNVENLLAIDAMEAENTPPNEYQDVDLFILEKAAEGAHEVEVFHLYTDFATEVTEVTHVTTIALPADLGEACDLELLPANPDYMPNPGAPSLVVLFGFELDGYNAGYIAIYDPVTGEPVENIGTVTEPSFFDIARYVDVVNSTFTIMATSEMMEGGAGVMQIFTFMYI
jgi:hypothetical protein